MQNMSILPKNEQLRMRGDMGRVIVAAFGLMVVAVFGLVVYGYSVDMSPIPQSTRVDVVLHGK